jgi:hypothetical protein
MVAPSSRDNEDDHGNDNDDDDDDDFVWLKDFRAYRKGDDIHPPIATSVQQELWPQILEAAHKQEHADALVLFYLLCTHLKIFQ